LFKHYSYNSGNTLVFENFQLQDLCTQVNNYNTIMNRKNDMNHEVLFTSFENQAYEYTTSSMVRGKCYSVKFHFQQYLLFTKEMSPLFFSFYFISGFSR